MAEEVFKTIPEFEDYQVSNLGRVITNKNGKSKFLTPQRDAIGYMHVRLYPSDDRFGSYGKGRGKKPKLEKVHRLVALLFLPKPDKVGTLEVNHKSGDKSDNNVTNLEWTTRQQNIQHSWDIGLRDNSAEKAALSRYKPVKVITDTGEVIYYQSRVHCNLDLDLSPSQAFYFISRGVPARSGKVKGYQFFDAPEMTDNKLFRAIANAEEKLLRYKQTYNEYYKKKARERRKYNKKLDSKK